MDSRRDFLKKAAALGAAGAWPAAVERAFGIEPEPMALSLCAMLEGLWLRLMMGDGTTREKALEAAIAFVVAVFPAHLTLQGPKAQ